jgi:hypothetical protein
MEVKVKVTLRPTISRPVRLGVRRPSGTHDQFFFLLEIPFRHLRVCYFVLPSLTRGGSVIYCRIASGPCQSSHSWVEIPQNSRPYFTVSSETPPTWRARYPYLYPPGIPQEQGGPVIPPGTGFPFCRLLRLAGLRWRYSNPPPHGVWSKVLLFGCFYCR